MNVIRTTQSFCPVCIKEVKGRLIEESGNIYFEKKCSKHGRFRILQFKDLSYFKKLNQAYSILPKNKIKIKNKECFNVILSYGCDLDHCTCCGSSDYHLNPPFNLIENKIDLFRNAKINILGCHIKFKKKIIELVKLIKRSKNVSMLYSQGPLLADEMFLKKLRKEGLDKVVLFFESYDDNINKEIKGNKLLNIKRKALSNLKKLNVPTIINMTVLRNKNEKDVKKVINFALNNEFIKAIEFRGYFPICGYGVSANNQLGNDEIIDIINKNVNHNVSKDKVLLYQQLVYYFFSIMPGYLLFEQFSYPLFRDKSQNFKVVTDFVDFETLKKKVDKIYRLSKKGKKIEPNITFLSILLKLLTRLPFNNSIAVLFVFFNRWLNKVIKPCLVHDASLNNVCFLYFGVRENSIEFTYGG